MNRKPTYLHTALVKPPEPGYSLTVAERNRVLQAADRVKFRATDQAQIYRGRNGLVMREMKEVK